jgi:hypothetical protein
MLTVVLQLRGAFTARMMGRRARLLVVEVLGGETDASSPAWLSSLVGRRFSRRSTYDGLPATALSPIARAPLRVTGRCNAKVGQSRQGVVCPVQKLAAASARHEVLMDTSVHV